MDKEKLEITHTWKEINAKNACFDGSRFECVGAERMYFEDVSLAGTKITNANLSDLEIDGAQMGGVYIHNIGMPGPEHNLHNPDAKQRPMRFENCEMEGSQISNCNLANVEIVDCDLSGMKINGILVEELLRLHDDAKQ